MNQCITSNATIPASNIHMFRDSFTSTSYISSTLINKTTTNSTRIWALTTPNLPNNKKIECAILYEPIGTISTQQIKNAIISVTESNITMEKEIQAINESKIFLKIVSKTLTLIISIVERGNGAILDIPDSEYKTYLIENKLRPFQVLCKLKKLI